MNIETVSTICFSPTGTTRKVVEAIARGMSPRFVQSVDLTLMPTVPDQSLEFEDTLVILGIPVYSGRIPPEAIRRLEGLKGKNTLGITIVVYGNREYEDALLELRDLVLKAGIKPVAGGAFIGEHSFSNDKRPIAHGRPDKDDIEKAEAFGGSIARKLAEIEISDESGALKIPGNYPYVVRKRKMRSDISPTTDKDLCILCGTCATVCPTGAVSVNDEVITDPEACIMCCACVKNCPTKARAMESPEITRIVEWLYENYHARKEPEIFL